MKNLFNLIIGLSMTITCFAQEKESLHIPAEYEAIGQKFDEGLDYIFEKMGEYAKANQPITKEGMDSVRRVATLEFTGKYPEVEGWLSGKQETPVVSLELQALLEEIQATVKGFNPKMGLKKLEQQLGIINRKAAETLSEADAGKVYAISATSYYSARYWQTNAMKWQKLGEYVKTKKDR